MKIVLLIALFFVSGCASLGGGHNVPINQGVDNTGVGSINLPLPDFGGLPSLLLVGFVLSVVGIGLGFAKLGGVTAIACVAGLLLRSVLSVGWFIYLSAFILLATILVVAAGIVFKNKALKEIIVGIQEYKAGVLTEKADVECVNDVLKSNQSSITQKLVKAVKNKLKLNGVIK